MIYSTQTALDQFKRIATLDLGDPMPDSELLTLQVELYRWQQHNFGGAHDWQMALGMIEEAGELDEATDDDLSDDAIGDIAVFGCQLLTLHRLGFNIAVQDAEHLAADIRSGVKKRPLIQAMGRVAKTVLKGNQKIRGLADTAAYREAVYRVTVDILAAAMGSRYVLLGPIVYKVARDVVLKRGPGHKAIPTA